MKYIDAEKLKAEIERRIAFTEKCAEAACEKNLHNTLEANEMLIRQYKSLLATIDSLQQEPIEKDEEIEKLIVRDIMEATGQRVYIDKQDKDKEEEAMLEKINYLRHLGLNECEQK